MDQHLNAVWQMKIERLMPNVKFKCNKLQT